MTKLIHDAKKYGIHLYKQAIKVDIRGEKRYQEMAKDTFMKPREELKNFEDDNEDFAGLSTHENSLRDTKKPPAIL